MKEAPHPREGKWWTWQAGTGVLLVLFVGIHWVAQHYLAPGGLRTYEQVVAYVRQPVVFVLEALFLPTVVVHALLGIRALALDLGISPTGLKRLTWVLALLGLLAVFYGWWLLWYLN